MKSLRNIFCCIFLLSCAVAFGQPKVVAVTEIVDKYEHIPYSVKLQLRASLTKAISQKQGYAAVDRTDISHILEEQTFQRTGLVDDTTIKKLGSITGAKFILLAEAVKTDSSSSIYVNVKMMDVETARVIITEGVTMSTASIELGCSELVNKIIVGNYQNANAKIVKLYDYLIVFPNDLGDFRACPTAIISNINKNATHGYDSWRLPTNEELSLIRNMAHEIPGFRNTRYMTSDKTAYDTPTSIRLVTTGSSLKEQEDEERKRSIEDGNGDNGVYKVGYPFRNYKGQEGRVFSVSSNGKSGKACQFIGIIASYDDCLEDAKTFFRGRIPALYELKMIYAVRHFLDDEIKGHYCWSSTPGTKKNTVYVMHMGTGQVTCASIYNGGACTISIYDF